jgi:alginate O-acetyltransferase complex protein AlgI
MNIQSLSYLLFVPVVWLLAMTTRRVTVRQLILLLASYAFYATWGWSFLAVLIASSILNWAWGRVTRKNPTVANMWIGVAINIAILIVFKYLPVVAPSLPGDLLHRLIMPVGVSFWTFQALSYQIDLYREEELDPTLVEFSLYMAFWPTVLSGPVCRLPEMLPQFRVASSPKWNDIAIGCQRILVGLFMKLVLANILANGTAPGEGILPGFDQMTSGWGAIDIILLALGYGFQLFFDFAGYSHIVIGTARLFGIELAENFDRPYLATTPSMFWTRWHMSLSFWIRDYLFMPIAARRRDLWWRNGALVFTMIVFGIWHGATLPFIVWGAYQGLLLVGHRLGQQFMKKRNLTWPTVLRPLSWMLTIALICLGWIFFRAHTLGQAVAMLGTFAHPAMYTRFSMRPNFYLFNFLIIGGYFLVEAIRALLERWDTKPTLERVLWILSPPFYATLILLVILWSAEESLFVYFQF